jgi:sulfur carrier protein ThiS
MELILDNEKKAMEFRGTIGGLLKSMKLAREEVVVKLNGRLAADTVEIGSDDTVEVIKVVFGG